MKPRWIKKSTEGWIESVATLYDLDPDTVKGIYKEMKGKDRYRAKGKTLEFFQLYFEGRNENGSDVKSRQTYI